MTYPKRKLYLRVEPEEMVRTVMGHLSKFLAEHTENLGRSYMVRTPKKVKYDKLNVLLAF